MKKTKLLAEVKKYGFSTVDSYRDFLKRAFDHSDIDFPVHSCIERELESIILDDDDRQELADNLANIYMKYWHMLGI